MSEILTFPAVQQFNAPGGVIWHECEHHTFIINW